MLVMLNNCNISNNNVQVFKDMVLCKREIACNWEFYFVLFISLHGYSTLVIRKQRR